MQPRVQQHCSSSGPDTSSESITSSCGILDRLAGLSCRELDDAACDARGPSTGATCPTSTADPNECGICLDRVARLTIQVRFPECTVCTQRSRVCFACCTGQVATSASLSEGPQAGATGDAGLQACALHCLCSRDLQRPVNQPTGLSLLPEHDERLLSPCRHLMVGPIMEGVTVAEM